MVTIKRVPETFTKKAPSTRIHRRDGDAVTP
jgi:hypothetical protein